MFLPQRLPLRTAGPKRAPSPHPQPRSRTEPLEAQKLFSTRTPHLWTLLCALSEPQTHPEGLLGSPLITPPSGLPQSHVPIFCVANSLPEPDTDCPLWCAEQTCASRLLQQTAKSWVRPSRPPKPGDQDPGSPPPALEGTPAIPASGHPSLLCRLQFSLLPVTSEIFRPGVSPRWKGSEGLHRLLNYWKEQFIFIFYSEYTNSKCFIIKNLFLIFSRGRA